MFQKLINFYFREIKKKLSVDKCNATKTILFGWVHDGTAKLMPSLQYVINAYLPVTNTVGGPVSQLFILAQIAITQESNSLLRLLTFEIEFIGFCSVRNDIKLMRFHF